MKKLIMRIVIGLGALVLLVLVSAIVLPIVFRDKIEAAIKEEVNKNLLADVNWGKWSFSILRSFPNITAGVTDIVITNRAPFEGIELANIGKFSVTLDIKSLLRDDLDILRVSLDKPDIHVRVMANGTANYNITVPSEQQTETSPFHIQLKEYAIHNGHVVYEDLSQNIAAEIYNLEHTGSGNFTQDQFTLRTNTGVGKLDVRYGGITYVRKANVDLAADIEVDVPSSTYRFSENQVSINELVLGFEGWLAMKDKGYDMDITWNTKRSELSSLLSLIPAEFASDLRGVDMSGKATFSGQLKGMYQGDILPSFSLIAGVENGRFQYPDLPRSAENINLDLSVNYPGGSNLDLMVIDLRKLTLNMAGNPVEARMRLTQAMNNPTIDAALKARLDLATVGQVIPMEEDLQGRFSADVQLAGALNDIEAQRYDRFEAEGTMTLQDMTYSGDSVPVPVGIKSMLFEFSPRFLSLENFDGSLGSSKVQASGRMDNYLQWWLKDEMLHGNFDLKADKLDLNEFMADDAAASSTSEKTPETKTSPESATTSQMSVIEVPANIDFTLNTSANEVLYQNLSLTNVSGQVNVRNQRVDLRDLFFNLLGGSVTVNGGYETTNPASPGIDLQYEIRDLDLARASENIPLLERLAPIAKHCVGRFSSSFNIQTKLDEHMEPVMTSLKGRGNLRSNQLQISGFEPLTQLASVLKIKELSSATLDNLNLSFKVEDGKVKTDPFDIKIGKMQARVGGSMLVADQSIDYNMTSQIPTTLFGVDANQTVGSLLGIKQQALGSFAVPENLDASILFTGTISKPIIKPQFAGGMNNIVETVVEEAKEQLNEAIDNTKAEAIAEAKAERDRLIAEAQKQADKIKADARTESAKVKAAAYKAADDELAKVKNPLAKAGAKLAADKAKQEADKKEQQALAESDKRADAIVEAARKQGDELVRKAEESNTTVK